MDKRTFVIGAGLALAFISGFYSDIVGDLTTLGLNPAIIDIGKKLFERAVESIAGVALVMHYFIPGISKEN